MHKQLFLIAAVNAFFAFFAFVSFDARASAFSPSKIGFKSDQVTQVAGGCGAGRHRGPGGRCIR
jgi:hypothetical protein